jgi:hypothetical protein
VAQPAQPPTLTPEEQRLMTLLRLGPQSINILARAMHMHDDQIDSIVRSLDGKVGLVPLFRSGTLCYGLAE